MKLRLDWLRPAIKADKVWLLVARGLHQGARLALGAGRHSIGSDLGDDVLLGDEGIAARHLVLEVGESAVTVVAEGGAAMSIELSQALQAGDRLELPWSALRGRGHRIELGTAVTIGLSIEQPRAEEAAAASTAGGSARWQQMLPWRGGKTPAPAATAALSCALVLAGVAALGVDRTATQPRSTQDPAELRTLLTERDAWRQLNVASGPQGRIALTGMVPNRAALQEALRLGPLADAQPVVRVVVGDEVLRHVSQAVRDPAVKLELQAATAERPVPLLVASGTTQRAGLPSLLGLLKQEWSGRVEIVDRTLYEADAANRRTLKVELPVRIVAVNLTERYVETADGKRFLPGSTVTAGTTLEAIEDEQLVFMVDGRRVDYRLP
jgi:Inner membrane component of T3SS, cytoplasmic domain